MSVSGVTMLPTIASPHPHAASIIAGRNACPRKRINGRVEDNKRMEIVVCPDKMRNRIHRFHSEPVDLAHNCAPEECMRLTTPAERPETTAARVSLARLPAKKLHF